MAMTTTQSILKVTPVINTAQYTSGDQVGGILTVSNAAFDADRAVKLTHLTLIDMDEQDANLTLFLFDDLPTVSSANNDALSLSDAEILAKCVGLVSIGSSDYVDCAGSHIVQKTPNLLLRSVHTSTEARKSGNLYALLSTTSTPTYSAVSSLKLILGFDS